MRGRGRGEDGDEGAWISLGRLMHAVLSFRTRLAPLFRRRPPLPAATRGRAPRRGASSRVSTAVRTRAHEEEAEDELTGAPTPRAPRKPRPAATPKPARRSTGGYTLPPLELLTQPSKTSRDHRQLAEMLQENATALEGVLGDFGVRGEIINARPGPVVTLYEFEPAPGIKSSRVISLADDIARSMSALSARVAVVSGRNAIGIELPNPTPRKSLSARIARLARLRRHGRARCRCASARRSAASRCWSILRACRICSSPAPPARANRSPSTP